MDSADVTVVDTYFERFRFGKGFKYRCTLCKGRAMNAIKDHKELPSHKAMVASQEAIDSNNQQHLGSFLQDNNMDSSDKEASADEEQDKAIIIDDRSLSEDLGFTEALMQLLTGNYSDSESELSDSSDNIQPPVELANVDWEALLFNKLNEDQDQSSTGSNSDGMSSSDIDDVELEEDKTQKTPRIDTDWYPFTKEFESHSLAGCGIIISRIWPQPVIREPVQA
ncbi:uncharacterized protein MELLADRAFT_89726 [Melampsora larici-populina 98AG31]|uniref:Uncharacterized protein n=1 Tax=Melampsora larici-populina (strain 98AG31 / pathotype 3-4-7) TaxID=747676 RepID=F4RUE2_MELLP|nr:uncharacterized protein MELLADRAFT_89726 [Melampsora larici-populina 98AG31]EGG03917.1 hypothetical protein MELLADRAFT_89726 [Melampsora larici-populina 98AG31]